MRTILITGALGYISNTLIKLLKLHFLNEKIRIIGVDNNFIPYRVANLVENGVEFHHKDLFNIRDILPQADVIIHTGGVTDVPQTITASTVEKDLAIWKVGVDGTKEIIQYSRPDCKIIFLSTHVVFEGLKSEVFNITEDMPPCPVLAYSRSKYQSEIDLLQSGRNSIILRLASVYGYNDSMRWKIVANLFAKMAAVNRKIKVFGAECYKPLVAVEDVALAIIRFATDNTTNEIFNVVREHLQVREIAELCRKIQPNIEIDYTNEEVINKGYTMSNAKILNTGFTFKNNIEDSIKDMIQRWSNTNQ